MSEEPDPNLDSLIGQLKDTATVNNHVEQNYDELCENMSPEEQFEARLKLSKIPRNASKVRIRNRCT